MLLGVGPKITFRYAECALFAARNEAEMNKQTSDAHASQPQSLFSCACSGGGTVVLHDISFVLAHRTKKKDWLFACFVPSRKATAPMPGSYRVRPSSVLGYVLCARFSSSVLGFRESMFQTCLYFQSVTK